MNATRRALVAALAASPVLLRASDGEMRRLGFLSVGRTEPLLKALASFGWEVPRNLHFSWRTVPRSGPVEQRATAARELLAAGPDVVAAETSGCARALVDAAPKLPVVAIVWDPVLEGFAQSLGRPGGSVTGVSFEAPKGFLFMMQTMRLMLPGLQRFHALATADFNGDPTFLWVRNEARALGVEIVPHDVGTVGEATRALHAVGDRRREAAFLFRVPGLDAAEVVRRAREARIALSYIEARTGALLACSYVHNDVPRTFASLIDKILRGASPATLPFEAPTRLSLEINRATAQALGIEIPPELLMRATAIHG